MKLAQERGSTRLATCKGSNKRWWWFYYLTESLKWLFVAAFSLIIGINWGGGSFYTLHKFKLGAFTFPPTMIIFLFAFAALGFVFAYSNAVGEKVTRWQHSLENVFLCADEYAHQLASQGHNYAWSFIKFIAIQFWEGFSVIGDLSKLERHENKVISTWNKLSFGSRLSEFFNRREAAKSRRFISGRVDDLLKATLRGKGRDAQQVLFDAKLKKRTNTLTMRDSFLALEPRNHHALYVKAGQEVIETSLRQLETLAEFSNVSQLTDKQFDQSWKFVQLRNRDTELQISDLNTASDNAVYSCFLKVYKYLYAEKNIPEERAKKQAVGIFRMMRVNHSEVFKKATEQLNIQHKDDKTNVLIENHLRELSRNAYWAMYPESNLNQETIEIDETFEKLISAFYENEKRLLGDFYKYEQLAIQQDLKHFNVLLGLNVLQVKDKANYLKRHQNYRAALRHAILKRERGSLEESATYALAPKTCLQFSAYERAQYAKLNMKRYQGVWSKRLYLVAILFGIVNALANGFLGFLGILSITVKLLGLPVATANIFVVSGATCAILASLCLTFPRILSAFSEIGYAIDTRGVTFTRNRGAKIWGAISALGAGLVSGSFVFLSLVVSTYFMIDQTGWIFLSMTPVLTGGGLIFSLATLVGAASLYRPELTQLAQKLLTPIQHWWQGLRDPFSKRVGIFEKFLKGVVLTICGTAFITAFVTAKVALPHAIQFISTLLFSVHHVAAPILWPIAGFGMICSTIAIGVFVTTKQWKILGVGLGRLLDRSSVGRAINRRFNLVSDKRTGTWHDQQKENSDDRCLLDEKGASIYIPILPTKEKACKDKLSEKSCKSIETFVLDAQRKTFGDTIDLVCCSVAPCA